MIRAARRFLFLAVSFWAFSFGTLNSFAAPKEEFPDWYVRGVEAALLDPREGMAAATLLLIDPKVFSRIPAGDRAGAAIDKIIPRLEDADSNVRQAAVQALAALPLGNRAEALIDKIIPRLEDADSNVRQAAVQALAALPLGNRAEALIDKIIPRLEDSNFLERQATVRALAALPLGNRTGAIIDKIILRLEDDNSDVRQAAVRALAALPLRDRAGAIIDKIILRLEDDDSDVHQAAVQALAALPLGDRAGVVIDKISTRLEDSDWGVRQAAVQALAALPLGDRAGAVIDKIIPRLEDSIMFERRIAVWALAALPLGDRAGAVIDKIITGLENNDEEVRQVAVQALAALPLGDRAGAVIDKIITRLEDDNSNVRQAAVRALAALPLRDRAGAIIDKIILRLENDDSNVRQAAVQALAALPLGDRAGAVIDKIITRLEDDNSNVRRAAVQALAAIPLGDLAGAAIEKISTRLEDDDSNVRQASVQALAALPLGDRAGAVIDKIIPRLADIYQPITQATALEIANLPLGDRARVIADSMFSLIKYYRQLPREQFISISLSSVRLTQFFKSAAMIGAASSKTAIEAIAHIHEIARHDQPRWRALGHILTGGTTNRETSTLLSWLGKSHQPLPLAEIDGKPAIAEPILAVFVKNGDALSQTLPVRQELQDTSLKIINAACGTSSSGTPWDRFLNEPMTWLIELPTKGIFRQCWTDEQRETIVKLHALFQKTDKDTPHEAALAQHLASEGRMPIYQGISWSILGWTLFWLAFLLGFRWSSTIQAIFFWNPRVREMLSLWFIPLLLLLLPPLRRHLLTPFRDRLLMAANPGTFKKLAFFPEVPARLDDGSIAPVATHLERLHGTVIVRGEAGLGKTSALRWLAIKSATPVAFIHARDCADGVDAAIAKLIHSVQDVVFVKGLIHTRTLRVFIDGLNEVSAETRERVALFAKEMSRGDIYIGTQPIEWRRPNSARTLDLLPLRPDERKKFLLSRPVGADDREKCHGEDYKRAVEDFLRQSLDEAPTEEQRAAAELMLSNPFDLTFAADLLAKGTLPRTGALIDAAFHVADQGDGTEPGYQTVNGQPFPLEKFGLHAIAMRREDRNWFKPDEFPAEIACLLKAKLVVPRAVRGSEGEEDRIQFRHDRVWDFFIAAAFELDPDICEQHMDDVRFRGAYLRIADTWDPKAAVAVRDKLVVLAAETSDNLTINEFTRRLEKRIRAKKSAGKLAVVEQSADGYVPIA